MKITKKQALSLIKGTKGKYFSVTFQKEDKTMRTMNCQYKKREDNVLGYVLLNDRNDNNIPKNVNLRTLKSLTISGVTYNC